MLLLSSGSAQGSSVWQPRAVLYWFSVRPNGWKVTCKIANIFQYEELFVTSDKAGLGSGRFVSPNSTQMLNQRPGQRQEPQRKQCQKVLQKIQDGGKFDTKELVWFPAVFLFNSWSKATTVYPNPKERERSLCRLQVWEKNSPASEKSSKMDHFRWLNPPNLEINSTQNCFNQSPNCKYFQKVVPKASDKGQINVKGCQEGQKHLVVSTTLSSLSCMRI